MNTGITRGRDRTCLCRHFPFAIFFLLLLSGCESIPWNTVDVEIGECSQDSKLIIEYLGVSGFQIQHGRDVVLTDPFFSHQALSRVLSLRPLKHGQEIIEDNLKEEADKASAIFVGHGHFDHAMDIPYIASNRAKKAQIYGGPSVINLLSAQKEIRDRLNPAIQGDEFRKVPGSNVSFRSFESTHAPQLPHITLFNDSVEVVPDNLPVYAKDWRDDSTRTYFLKFDDDNKQEIFSVYIQGAAAEGKPDIEREVDVALLSAGSHKYEKNYPEDLLELLKPKIVIISHWENFLRTYSQSADDVRVVPLIDANGFYEKVRGSEYTEHVYFLMPGTSLSVCSDKV